MFKSIKLSQVFSKGEGRTRQITKNIIASFIIKGGNVIIGFVMIPLTINYVNPTQYGIWLTLNSMTNWFSFFDIGLGNGLRNKIAEANALNEPLNTSKYISTTYASLAIISGILFVLFFLANHFINWNIILNISPAVLNNLQQIALFIFACFCVQLVVQVINVVLTGFHLPSRVSLLSFIGQLLSLAIIYILTLTTKGSLWDLVIVLVGVPLVIQFLASLWYYNTDYKNFRPRLNLVDFKYARQLLKVGGLFFIIQIGALVLMETDNIVITQIFGPKEVTVFNVAFKLFWVILIVFSIVMTPFWSAFTEAYFKNDFDWIKSAIKKLYYFLAAITLASFLLFAASPFIYEVWVGKQIKVPPLLSFTIAVQVIAYCWLIMSCYFLNGIGKIRMQFYMYVVCIVINIPLSIFLCKITNNIVGVTLSNLIMYLYMDVVLFIQCRKILNRTATGVWNK